MVSTLSEVGDLAAPPGSHEWAVAMRIGLQGALKDHEVSVKDVQWRIDALKEHSGHERLVDKHGKPFKSFADFCKTPSPWGLGYDERIIIAIQQEANRERSIQEIIDETRPLLDVGPPTLQEVDIVGQSNNKSPAERGSCRDYWVARMKRDRPDLIERLEEGEFPSVRAAAIEAGIVKVKTELEQLQHWWEKAGPGMRATFIDWLCDTHGYTLQEK